MVIVVFWCSSGSCRFCVVSVSGATTASVVMSYMYVPGVKLKFQDPVPGVGTMRMPATGETGVGCGGAGRGTFAGTGAGVEGAAAHASMTLIAPAAKSAVGIAADIVFSLIAES